MPKSILRILNEEKKGEEAPYQSPKNESIFRERLDIAQDGCLNIINSIRSIEYMSGGMKPEGIDKSKEYIEEIIKYKNEPVKYEWNSKDVQNKLKEIEEFVKTKTEEIEKRKKKILEETMNSSNLLIPNKFLETAMSLHEKANKKRLSLSELDRTKEEVKKIQSDIDPSSKDYDLDQEINMVAQKGGTGPNKTKSTQESTRYLESKESIYHFLSVVNVKSTDVIKKEFNDTAKKNILLDNAVKFLGNIYDKEYSIKKGTSPLDDSEFADDLLYWIKYTSEYKKYKIEDDDEKKGVEIKPTGLDQTKGNAFRAWVNKEYPSYAKKIDLSKKGSPDNNFIRQAYSEYGEEWEKWEKNKEN